MTISVSIVSHGQADHVRTLLLDLERCCVGPLELLVTLNVPESHALRSACNRFPLSIVANEVPRGFGANHNAAFARATGEYFCVLNPDLRLATDPFPVLLDCLADKNVGVCAPSVVSPKGCIEDSAREFPTPISIAAKALGLRDGTVSFADFAERVHPDWVAGMFMLFRSPVYRALSGFDERYHLYYEDVELCARLRLGGFEVVLCPRVSIVHDARRDSRRQVRYLVWHLSSMLRFFASTSYRTIRNRRGSAR